jgi:ribonuclease HI
MLNEIMGKARRAKEGVCVGFVDFSKAFPSVSFAAIRAALIAFHVPIPLINMIMSIYSDPKAFVRTPFGDTEHFNILTGTFQGDVLAPFLFVMVLDRVLCQALDEDEGSGIQLQRVRRTPVREGLRHPKEASKRFTDVDYADDLALIAPTCATLSRMLSRVAFYAAKVNLQLNMGPKKTAWMSVGNVADVSAGVVLSDGRVVPKVSEYRHLGNLKSDSSDQSSEKERIQLGWAAVRKFRPIWNLSVHSSVKMRFFDALVLTVLSYGCSTWSLTEKRAREIDVVVNLMRRVVLGVDRMTPNVALRFNTRKFSTMQKEQRMSTIGHLLRGDTGYSDIIQWSPQGEDHRHKVLSERCAKDAGAETPQDLIDLAHNRTMWRRRTEQLVEQLEPTVTFVPVTAPQWHRLRHSNLSLQDRQFVEEGRTPYPLHQGALHMYTDGGMREVKLETGDVQKCAGYGVVFHARTLQKCFNMTEVCQELTEDSDMTNNRAEIRAVITAVKRAFSWNGPLVVHTDSEVVWHWAHVLRWKLLLDMYETVLNHDLWKVLNATLGEREVYFIKVRSHNGNPRNDEVDSIATRALSHSLNVRYPGRLIALNFDTTIRVKKLALEDLIQSKRDEAREVRVQEARSRRVPLTCERLREVRAMLKDGDRVVVEWGNLDDALIEISSGTAFRRGRGVVVDYEEYGPIAFPNPAVVYYKIKIESS